MKISLWILAALSALILALLAVSRIRARLVDPVAIWTPAPAARGFATDSAILPVTPMPTLADPATPGASPTMAPGPSPTPVAAPSPRTPAESSTPDPERVTITEAEVAAALASGVGAQQGLAISGLAVRFTDGRIRLTAELLSFRGISIRDLTLVGKLVAEGGQLQLQAETITPGGLITALIPALASQALAQYAGEWYIEEVQTLEGRLTVRIR